MFSYWRFYVHIFKMYSAYQDLCFTTWHNSLHCVPFPHIFSFLLFQCIRQKPPYPFQLSQIFVPSWQISTLSRFWHHWWMWWWEDCCHSPFSQVIVLTILFILCSMPRGFLNKLVSDMSMSVSKTYLTCAFISFNHSIPSKMPHISLALAVCSLFSFFTTTHTLF